MNYGCIITNCICLGKTGYRLKHDETYRCKIYYSACFHISEVFYCQILNIFKYNFSSQPFIIFGICVMPFAFAIAELP